MIDPKDEDRISVEKEFSRMGFDKDSVWRISDINKDFELCNSYPRYLILPSDFSDEEIDSVAKFRYFRRIPTAVWRHARNGCFIVRSSQPTVGWFGWFRNEMDESLVLSYVNITKRHTISNGNHNGISCANPIKDLDGNENNPNNGQACAPIEVGDESGKMRHRRGDDDLEDTVDNHNENGKSCDHMIETIRDECSMEDHSGSSSIAVTTSINGNGFESLTYGSTKVDDFQNHAGDRNTKDNHNRKHPDSDAGCCETHQCHKTALALGTKEIDPTPSSNHRNIDSSLANELAHSASIAADRQTIASKRSGSTSSEESSPEHATQPTKDSDIHNQTPSATANDSVTAELMTTTIPSSKMLIIDARSYAAAVANRAKGGGCECSEYYQGCEVHFMNLANIHSIRKSYQAIRGVCEAYSEQSNNWVSFLDNSRWLHHISGLIKSSLLVVDAIDIEEKSIMIHCSDGWDRTPQLVALAEIMLDSHYRTFEGFKVLIQREWLDFGHKFADRCGSNPCNEDPNERCPVFLQWLDCVQQLLVQYPKHFEFNSAYLDKLNRHTYSNIFGTFSYNSTQERILSKVDDKLLSLWSYFESARNKYMNESYVPNNEILRPSFKVKDLHFWKEVYLPPINQPKNSQASFIPIPNNIDNNKCSQDSLFIDGPANRTVCK